MLLTKWGQDLNKYHPLSEYPRPQFVRNSYLNLNGVWQLSFSKSSAIPNDFEYEITVPFSPECPLSGVNRVLNADEYLIYQRSFDISPDFNKGRVFIRFGAVDQIACIYINKHKVGVHHGGYTPFSFEIKEYIKGGGKTNQVLVCDFCGTKQNLPKAQKPA